MSRILSSYKIIPFAKDSVGWGPRMAPFAIPVAKWLVAKPSGKALGSLPQRRGHPDWEKAEGCFLGFLRTSPSCHSACSCWGTFIHPGPGGLICRLPSPRPRTFIFLTSSLPAKCQPVTSASPCRRSQWNLRSLPGRYSSVFFLMGTSRGGNELVTKVTLCGCVLGNLGLGLAHVKMSALPHPSPAF